MFRKLLVGIMRLFKRNQDNHNNCSSDHSVTYFTDIMNRISKRMLDQYIKEPDKFLIETYRIDISTDKLKYFINRVIKMKLLSHRHIDDSIIFKRNHDISVLLWLIKKHKMLNRILSTQLLSESDINSLVPFVKTEESLKLLTRYQTLSSVHIIKLGIIRFKLSSLLRYQHLTEEDLKILREYVKLWRPELLDELSTVLEKPNGVVIRSLPIGKNHCIVTYDTIMNIVESPEFVGNLREFINYVDKNYSIAAISGFRDLYPYTYKELNRIRLEYIEFISKCSVSILSKDYRKKL